MRNTFELWVRRSELPDENGCRQFHVYGIEKAADITVSLQVAAERAMKATRHRGDVDYHAEEMAHEAAWGMGVR